MLKNNAIETNPVSVHILNSSQFILTKQQRQPGHIMQKRGIFKNPDLHSSYFARYRKAIAYKAHTRALSQMHTHPNNSYSVRLKEAMHNNKA